MNSIKILVPIHTKPNIISDTTLLFKSLLPELRKIVNVTIIWVVYQPEKIKTSKNENEKILDIHDYENFIDILQKEKPDLVYAAATYSIIDFAISSASRHLKIPVLSKIYSRLGVIKEKNMMMKSMITRAFEQHVPTDEKHTKKQFMKRGRFFFYKFRYMLKTIYATEKTKITSLKISLKILRYFFSIGKHEGYPELANTAHWLESEYLYQKLIDMGYNEKSLFVTGNPMYDEVIKKVNSFKKMNNKKLTVLFMPLAYYEHGMWTQEQNEKYFQTIIEKLNKNKEISLSIKLHPSSHRFEYYNRMIKTVNQNIKVFQKGDALDHILQSDIIISYAGHGTSLVNVLLCKKPLILCNFDQNDDGPILNKQLATKCEKSDKLNLLIKEAIKKNQNIEKDRKNFLEEFFYKLDGNASKRMVELIMKITKN
jgi:UDP-N-acetylglucosamine transferase subunit ALG13